MAQKLRVDLYCDVCNDEVPAMRTMAFAFDDDEGKRRDYNIELCGRHLRELGETITPWIARARLDVGGNGKAAGKTGSGSTGHTRNGAGAATGRRDPEQLAAIRAWARENGYQVSDKGRIPREVEEAYSKQAAPT